MAHKSSKVFNLQDIQHQARESIMQGAVTTDYGLDVAEACKHLNVALATEIMCVLRYRHHQIIAKGIDCPQVAAEFKEHAHDEEHHMMLIAERINQLGGNPDFNPATINERTTTGYHGGGDIHELIKDNLIEERVAIMIYRKLIEWFGSSDPTTRRMLEKILKDEEDHADDLSDLLA